MYGLSHVRLRYLGRPIQEACPQCGAAFLVEKRLKGGGTSIRCATEGCAYVREDAAEKAKA